MSKKISEKGFKLEDIAVMTKQNDSTATDVATLKADFNSLLSKLKSAGLMKSS